ncbi:methylmalonyl-CoA mutase [Flavobacteriaceae bacterium MAR_2010_188]|nr:methylmalonyl-CoA mutase [Flavobacteriaceae bacterium MAR_2010_188]
MADSLFDEFSKVSTKQWKQQIQFDLNGLDYNNALIWNSPEGIDVKPFYNEDDAVFHEKDSPEAEKREWFITDSIFVADVSRSNENALDKIERGTESIKFIIPDENVDFSLLIKGINPTTCKIQLECLFLSSNYVQKIQKEHKEILFHTDIIGNLARSGNWFKNLKEDYAELSSISKSSNSISIDTTLYQNAGGLIQQQLAYGLAHLNEYLNYFETNKLFKDELNVHFKIAVGSNYFFEIAKVRALRILVKELSVLYNFKINLKVHAIPSKRNKTIYDYNTNLLRTTTECMSAIIGGIDFIENLPYDALYHKNNEFGDRIARNQLLILKHESGFEETANSVEGCYYIESITKQLAEKALTIFKEIEKNGGFLENLKTNKLQSKIKESADKEQSRFDSDEKKLVGTNFVINTKDRMKDELQLYPFIKRHARKTLIQPIIERRLSEELEKKRLEEEN